MNVTKGLSIDIERSSMVESDFAASSRVASARASLLKAELTEPGLSNAA
jgi:hypothetical protein